MQLQLDDSLKARIPGVIFGTVTIHGVSVRERAEILWRQIEALSQRQASMEPHVLQHYVALAGQRMVECNGGRASDALALTV